MGSRLDGLSIFHPQGFLSRPSNPFGKDIANAALFRGLLEHGRFSNFAILNQTNVSSDQIISSLGLSSASTIISTSLDNTSFPAQCGTLLRGQPYLSELAWIRRHKGLDTAYSLVGLIHTIAPPAVRQEMAASIFAPTYEWDALVCTSPAVQQAMNSMFDSLVEHYSSRFKALKIPRPSLPLIPLAVDVEKLHLASVDSAARIALRKRLLISDDDVLVLWVGRLSYYEKAFPQSMFQALEIASHEANHKLHFLLVGWFPGGESELKLYEQAANILAPSVNVVVMNGNDPDVVSQAWAASDIFLSLVDNIQETFGLTPVEAMAAGRLSLAFTHPKSGMGWVGRVPSLSWSQSPYDLSSVLQRLGEDPLYRLQLCKESRDRYLRLFSLPVWCNHVKHFGERVRLVNPVDVID